MTTPKLVVPLDGTEQALSALPIAKHLAELEHATVHFVSVADEVLPPDRMLAKLGLYRGELRGSVLDTKTGEPAARILEAARELPAALIVLCPYTASAGGKIIGRTALKVLLEAPCPIIFVRPDCHVTSWSLRRILLPHDGTPTTSVALHSALELARSADAELTVLHVVSPHGAPSSEPGAIPPPLYMDQPQHEWPSWVGEFLERLACASSLDSIRVRLSLARGEPGEATLRFAEEQPFDLIVLAWRGDWGEGRAQVVKTILRGANCPVLVGRVD